MSINLRKLNYSPMVNPLVSPQSVTSKRRVVRSGRADELINPTTGEVQGIATVHEIKQVDDAEFVKVFAAGVSASYELSRTAQRVFQVVLDQYQRTPMSRGYADAIELFWFGEGIEGRDLGMSEKTFQRGLKELLGKFFLAPKGPSTYWTNPSLFFKGDRVLFIREYQRRKSSADEVAREKLEAQGQLRIEELPKDDVAE